MATNFDYTGGLETMITAYLECALWSSSDGDSGDTLDALYTIDDIAAEALAMARADCQDFLDSNRADLADINASQVGHDFWLTRNRHGAGFWDRGLGAIGRRLTDSAHAYGSADAYVGDDGSIYLT